MSDEVWKEHPAYPGCIVSSQGRVARVMAASPDKDGYLRSRATTSKRRSVHSLVLETFVGPRPVGAVGRHLNDVPNDCTLQNLQWGTPKENSADAIRNGKYLRGTQVHTAKLTLQKVCEIRSRAKRGNYQSLGREYGVTGSLIGLIVKRKVWTHAS